MTVALMVAPSPDPEEGLLVKSREPVAEDDDAIAYQEATLTNYQPITADNLRRRSYLGGDPAAPQEKAQEWPQEHSENTQGAKAHSP